MELGRVAAAGGRNGTAREAYAEAGRLSPNNPEIAKAIHQLDEDAARARAWRPDATMGIHTQP
jgi:cytochrome c-type biogenesis protein CcmH/NrfG